MSTTIAAGSPAFQTPLFPTSKRTSSEAKVPTGEEMEWEPTPVSVVHATPAFREVFEQFAETLDPVRDNDLIRIVVGSDGRRLLLFSHSSLSAPMLVVQVGEIEAGAVTDGAADALSVFNQVQAQLGVTQKEMFSATGIKKRTYHSWKRKSAVSRPRLASLGRLWQLADALEDLREVLDRPIAAWLHGAPERMSALRAGRFDDLIDLAVGVPKRTGKSFGTSSQTGLAAEVDLPVIKTEKPRITTVERGLRR